MQNPDNENKTTPDNELTYAQFKQCNNMQDTSNIQVINFVDCELINIEKISMFTNLVSLNLSNNKIQYLNDIDKCTNLEYLNLNNNFITNLTPISSFKKLTELHLANNQLHSVKQLIPIIQLAVTLKKLTLFSIQPLSNNYQYNRCIFSTQELDEFINEFLAGISINEDLKNLPHDIQQLYGKAKVHFNGVDYEYQGETLFLVPHGQGTIKYKDEKTFQGNFQFGFKTRGIEVCDEYKYKGSFDERGKRQGKGILELKSGEIYEGNFVDDKLTGKGTALYADNSFYEGDFEEGVRSGNGIFYDTDGSIFTGEWRNDKANGVGKYEDEAGNVEEGTWRENQKVA